MSAQIAKADVEVDTRHVFEQAGLGIAPFECIDRFFTDLTRVCDYCATCIHEVYVIKSVDNHTFIVGNVCIEKAGDEGLIDEVKRFQRERRHVEADQRIEAARSQLESVKRLLAAEPHPFAYLSNQGKTLLDYVEWLLENGGRTGKLKAAKMIEQTLSGTAVACELFPGWKMVYDLSTKR